MSGDRVEREVLIDAPLDVVWEVISRPEHIVQWFMDEVELDLRPGGDGTGTFVDRETGQPSSHRITVEAVEPSRRLAYRWLQPAGEDARPGNSTLVEFTLAQEGGGTRLRVVESGIQLMPWPPQEGDDFARSHGQGWGRHLERLRVYAAKTAGRTA